MVAAPNDYHPRYNIAPTQLAPVVRVLDGVREAAMLRWGLVPSWANDPSIGQKMINARSETAPDKPSFRSAFKRRRCLIPADGFFEWREEQESASLFETDEPTGKVRKQPYWITIEDQKPFAFAGLWEHWDGSDAQSIETYTILTCEPNKAMSPLHDRMPVILNRSDYDFWIDPEVGAEAARELCMPFDGEMQFTPVTPRMSNPRYNEPDSILSIR